MHASCLCGEVTWDVEGPLLSLSHCHCSRCRKQHGAAFATYAMARASGFRMQGEDRASRWESSPGFWRRFCRRCGSVVPGAPDHGSVFAVARTYAVDPSHGLTAAEIAARAQRYPANLLQEKRRRSPLRMLLDQFSDFMIIVLIGAAVVSGAIGDVMDTLAILVIVVLNAAIGFIQEFRAERAMAALKRLAAPTATVIRDGQRNTIPTAQLLPGDVVVLEAGNVVPADLRLCETVQLKVDESALTGESVTSREAPRRAR